MVYSVSMYWCKKSDIFRVKHIIAQYHKLQDLKICIRQKKSHALWEAGMTRNDIAIHVGFSKSAISKITRRTCSKWFNFSSKPKSVATDEYLLKRILISNRFVDFVDISKAWNDAGVAVSWSTTLQKLRQLRYDT